MCSWKTAEFQCQNAPKNCLATGLCSDLLSQLIAHRQTTSWIYRGRTSRKAERKRKGRERGRRKRQGRRGRDGGKVKGKRNREGKKKKGGKGREDTEISPTLIYKSRRLWHSVCFFSIHIQFSGYTFRQHQ